MYFFNRHLILVKGAGLWQHLKMNSCIFLQKLYSRRQWQGMLLLQICLNPDLERSSLEMSLRAHSILDLPAETLSRLPIYDVDLGLESTSSFWVDYQTSCEWWQLDNDLEVVSSQWSLGKGSHPITDLLSYLACRAGALHVKRYFLLSIFCVYFHMVFNAMFLHIWKKVE